MKWMIGFILLILGGCAGPQIFAKEGAGEAELKYDSYECKQQWERSSGAIAFKQDPMGNLYYGLQAKQDMRECLEHKGWKVVEK